MNDDDDNDSERAAALVHEALDLLRSAEDAPASPLNGFRTAKQRRALRRGAARLREGKAEPRYKNLYTAEELADLYERTVRRDEMFEQSVRDFKRIGRELARIKEDNPSEVQKGLKALILDAQRAAQEEGPGSEAARRFRNVMRFASLGRSLLSQKRRQKAPAPRPLDLAPDPTFEARLREMAAEQLPSPPSGEAVIAIPPEGKDSGRGRIFLRIGIGQASWVGSFERGHTRVSTIFMLPDRKHLFVSAEGAGYVIEAKSRTLVETTGTAVVGTMRDEDLTLFVVDHGGRSLEAFGTAGRLWKTGTISSGGFRGMAMTDDALVGEARLLTARTGWARFSVKIATGEVEIGA